MGIIVSAFSNSGKSYIKDNKNINCIDLDTHYFNSKSNWQDIYVECILALKDKYDYVFITTHGQTLNKSNELGIEYYLVYPKRELKDEYRKRAIKRGSTFKFILKYFSKWDKQIDACENNKHAKKIILDSGQYLSDVIDQLK